MPSRPTVRAANGLIASGHHLATAAGLAALREGANAADAAVVAAAVCCVVMPHRTSIGGDAFALVRDARTQRVAAINGSGAAPAALSLESFPDGMPGRGARVITVPGLLGSWAALLDRSGTFELGRALAPAIAYADDGFVVSDALAAAIAEHRDALAADPGCAEAFLPRGRPPRAGEVVAQPELAESLRIVASEGVDAFYRGALGERFATAVREGGGVLEEADLAAHRTDAREPLSIEYRGLRVFGQPPVSQGHVFLEELAMVSDDDLVELGWGSADLVHLMVEVKKQAFADRDHFAGDVPAFDPEALLRPDHARQRRGRVQGKASDHTTYCAVVDRQGNAVSLIESVFSEFGAAFIAPGTGILANNRLTGFSLDRSSPNSLAPGKRPVHTLNTVLVTDGSDPRFVFGTPGRHAQVQTNFQLAVALIDFEMDVQAAIDAPRWYHAEGRRLGLEARFPVDVRRALASKGHQVELLAEWDDVTGGAQAIAIDPETGVFAGGADPRREGYAAGY
jgi:gamma-glutamyltranspeptidase/glutathione hydrolase